MSKFKFVQWYGIVVCLLMAACTDVDITMPKGPKGDTGLSAYEFWTSNPQLSSSASFLRLNVLSSLN